MKRHHIAYAAGFGILLACYASSIIRITGYHRETGGAKKVIRVAHWQLETGIRGAMDKLARNYEAAHPDVRIEQVPIPERIYSQWLRTQLIGETACDVIELGTGCNDEMLARFFVPLGEITDRPNPYNRHTALEQTPWRDTFIDGMNGGWSYRPSLLDYYGVPLSLFTIRIFYNERLWEKILGNTPQPTDYDAFIAICQRVKTFSEKNGQGIIPIAGSKANAPMLIDKLIVGQTQKLALELNTMRNLAPTAQELAHGYLSGTWSVDTAAFADALSLSRTVQQSMQTGYEQLSREDAAFYFLQGKALMITTGSWDAPSFRQQAPFAIQVFDVPMPAPGHPRYGRNILGRSSEAAIATGFPFGVTRQSPHREVAVDFLQFVTSQEGNATFTQTSGWLPAVEGVGLPAEIKPFAPETGGYPNGFSFTLLSLGANSKHVFDQSMYKLSSPNGSVATFQDAVRSKLGPAIRLDLERTSINSLSNIARQDLTISAQWHLRADQAGHPWAAARLSELMESQNQQEGQRAWALLDLESPQGNPSE